MFLKKEKLYEVISAYVLVHILGMSISPVVLGSSFIYITESAVGTYVGNYTFNELVVVWILLAVIAAADMSYKMFEGAGEILVTN